MGFVKTVATTSRPEIADGVRKEEELLFHLKIVLKVEKYKIPYSIILNIDET